MEKLKVMNWELRLLDPSLLSCQQRLARLELLLATQNPEDSDNPDTWEEIVNKYSDDIGDDPEYHGYDQEDLDNILQSMNPLSKGLLDRFWKEDQEIDPILKGITLDKAIKMAKIFEDNPKGELENSIDAALIEMDLTELSEAK